MATPHIEAEKGAVAKSLLLPGDPRRAEYIAKNFLENQVQFNSLRGMLGYTGRYRGKEVSVMGSGMGIPSVSIYAEEMFSHFGVERILRIGTCGTKRADIEIGDILLAQGCSTTSDINRRVFGGTFCPVADFGMLRAAAEQAKALGKRAVVGNMLSADLFYSLADLPGDDLWWQFGVIGVEMEGAGLYTAALRREKQALMICTVSDSIDKRAGMPPEQRERSLNDMIQIGLSTIAAVAED